jgi:TRAP-type C4-dicarboxylate transport system permease small subunit
MVAGFTIVLCWRMRADWARDAGFDWWRMFEDGVSQFLMVAMLAAALLQVVARYALSDYISVPWTDEFGGLAMIWAALWGAAVLQRSDDHITMSVVHDLLPPSARLCVRVLGDIVVIAVMAPMVWLGWRSAGALAIITTPALGFPVSVFAYSVPVTGAVFILHTLVLTIQRLRGRPVASSFEPGV